MTENEGFTTGPAVDDMPPEPEAPPKRGPGRPKGSKNKTTTRRTGAAPRRGRPPGTSRVTRIGGFLTMVNMGIQMSPLRNDALDALEIDALAKALDEEAKKSATFARYLDNALGVAGAGGIWAVVGLIAARRGARHGILPPSFDSQAAMLLSLTARSNKPPSYTPPADTPTDNGTEAS